MKVAAISTWAVVSGLIVWAAVRAGPGLGELLLIAVVMLNGLAMMAVMRRGNGESPLRVAALSVQLASALAIGWLTTVSFTPIYTIIWVSIAASHYALRPTLVAFAGISVAWYLIMRFGWGESDALISTALFATFHLFAVFSATNAREARRAREHAEGLNRELMATQHLLSEASRQSERTRIARNLHDLLGHHLTALSINLQVAEHLAAGEARERIAESRALARLLLSDVRDAVDTLRDSRALDFERAVHLLVAESPDLEVHLDIEAGFDVAEVDVAESLLRCVQEGLTNTLRHSGASSSWIRVWREEGDLRLEMRDDGTAAANLREGNGLIGMRERLAEQRGTLSVDRVDAGVRLNVAIPVAG